MSDLSEQIAGDAATPKQVTVDGTSATQRPLQELIDADRYLKSQQAVSAPGQGLAYGRFKGGSPV